MDYEALKLKAKSHKCRCGGLLSVAWVNGQYALVCGNDRTHTDFERPHKTSVYNLPGYNMPGVIKRREKEMMQKYGAEKTKQMVRVGGGNPIATLTQAGASQMLTVLYPEATKSFSGQAAIIKGALICRDYGLNPAMDHIFLIPFDHKEKKNGQWVVVGQDWSVVRGIKASRLICGREKSYGYIDDTPRLMTEEEQLRIFGEVEKANLVTICKLKDKDGNVFPGYGRWPKDVEPKGVNKGNTKFNMSCIRAERQALDKLNPGAMPADVDVVDERFIEKPTVTVETEQASPQIEQGQTESEEGVHDIPLDEKAPPAPAQQAEGAKVRDLATIKNLGELIKAVTQDFPSAAACRDDVIRLSRVNDESEFLKIRDYAAAYNKIKEEVEKL